MPYKNKQQEPCIYTVICGSFRKHLPEIAHIKEMLERRGIGVLSPAGIVAKNPDEEFVILDSDLLHNHKILQDSVFAKMRRSSFVVIANIGGYIGKAACMEIGYAVANGIDVYTAEPISDPNLSCYCRLLSDVFPEISFTEECAEGCMPRVVQESVCVARSSLPT